MHAFAGDHRRAGDETVRRCLAYLQTDRVAPTGIHICRTSAEKGYFLFGEAADSVRMNPFIRSVYFRPSPKSPEHVAQWLTALAKRGCQPRPLFTVLDLTTLPTGEHRRSSVACTPRLGAYYVISRGSKGLLYRGLGAWLTKGENRAAVASLNAEVQQLKPLLTIAEPYGRVPTSDPRAEATLLMCGDQGALLLAINHTRLPAAAGGAGAHAPLTDIRVTLPRRSWLRASKAARVPAPEDADAALPLEREGESLVLTIPRLDEAQAIHIHGGRHGNR
jgi:hypothetical protein